MKLIDSMPKTVEKDKNKLTKTNKIIKTSQKIVYLV